MKCNKIVKWQLFNFFMKRFQCSFAFTSAFEALTWISDVSNSSMLSDTKNNNEKMFSLKKF